MINPWIIIIAASALISSYGFGYYMGWQGKIADYEADKASVDEETRVDNERVDKGYDIASKEIRKTPVSSCVGAGSAAAVDWLRHNYRK